jgi:hypothetical protein
MALGPTRDRRGRANAGDSSTSTSTHANLHHVEFDLGLAHEPPRSRALRADERSTARSPAGTAATGAGTLVTTPSPIEPHTSDPNLWWTMRTYRSR